MDPENGFNPESSESKISPFEKLAIQRNEIQKLGDEYQLFPDNPHIGYQRFTSSDTNIRCMYGYGGADIDVEISSNRLKETDSAVFSLVPDRLQDQVKQAIESGSELDLYEDDIVYTPEDGLRIKFYLSEVGNERDSQLKVLDILLEDSAEDTEPHPNRLSDWVNDESRKAITANENMLSSMHDTARFIDMALATDLLPVIKTEPLAGNVIDAQVINKVITVVENDTPNNVKRLLSKELRGVYESIQALESGQTVDFFADGTTVFGKEILEDPTFWTEKFSTIVSRVQSEAVLLRNVAPSDLVHYAEGNGGVPFSDGREEYGNYYVDYIQDATDPRLTFAIYALPNHPLYREGSAQTVSTQRVQLEMKGDLLRNRTVYFPADTGDPNSIGNQKEEAIDYNGASLLFALRHINFVSSVAQGKLNENETLHGAGYLEAQVLGPLSLEDNISTVRFNRKEAQSHPDIVNLAQDSLGSENVVIK